MKNLLMFGLLIMCLLRCSQLIKKQNDLISIDSLVNYGFDTAKFTIIRYDSSYFTVFKNDKSATLTLNDFLLADSILSIATFNLILL